MIRIKGYFPGSLLLTMFIMLLVTPLIHASPEVLNITVNTDKQNYWALQSINIYGDLTLDGQPVSDGLVALEVKDPSDNTIVIRTLQTGTTPPASTIYISQLIPCDALGQPKYEFRIGSEAHFLVIVNNTSLEPQLVLVTINIYDANGAPIYKADTQYTQGPTPMAWNPNFWIPNWVSTGTAKVYAGVYTGWPSAGGTPLCPEKSESFTIYSPGGGGGSSTGAQASSTSQSTDGTYSLSFTTSLTSETGTYTVYVTSSYQGQQATNNTTFLVNVPDINGDGFVNVEDLGLLSDAWLSQSGDPNYNPNADFNEDDFINVEDLGIMSDCWLWEPP